MSLSRSFCLSLAFFLSRDLSLKKSQLAAIHDLLSMLGLNHGNAFSSKTSNAVRTAASNSARTNVCQASSLSPLCALLVLREGQPAIQRLKITDVFLVGVPGSLLHRNRGLLSFNKK